jgi:hypothetical protein
MATVSSFRVLGWDEQAVGVQRIAICLCTLVYLWVRGVYTEESPY